MNFDSKHNIPFILHIYWSCGLDNPIIRYEQSILHQKTQIRPIKSSFSYAAAKAPVRWAT